MKKLSMLVLFSCLCVGLSVCVPQQKLFAAAALATKKVRITNNTTDTGIRARVVHFKPNIQFIRDVPKNQQKLITGVDTGSRGVIIWETLNEKVIATGFFELKASGLNIDVIVTGNKTAGYKISFAGFN